MATSLPSFEYEQLLWQQGYTAIAGIDEVGRGAFAGPVVVAAVIFPPRILFHDPLLGQINDSKKISASKRSLIAKAIRENAACYAIAEGSLQTINHIGIGKATQQAFLKVTNMLCHPPDYFLIDAFYIENLDKQKQQPIIHGDSLSISIAAASILAKVYRDELMRSFQNDYKEYDFATNKGYGTLKHRQQIAKSGLTPMHRTSFHLEKFLSHEIS